MHRPLAAALSACLACALIILPGAAAPTPAAGAWRMHAAQPALGLPTLRTFELDGRTITLAAQLVRTIPGAPLPDGPHISTEISVTMSVDDDEPLPEDLDVVGVRFEKLRGVRRFFFVPTPQLSTGDGGDDTARVYHGDLSDHPSVRFLKVVIRLERGDEVIKVNMGTMAVQQVVLP